MDPAVCSVALQFSKRCPIRLSTVADRALWQWSTRSSAVAGRPRDVSCPSVVSFNNTKPRVQSFIIVTSALDLPMRTIKLCSVVFGATSRLPVINKIHWCVAFRRPSPAINKPRRLMLPAMSVTNLPRSGGTLFTTSDGRAVDNTRWS